MNLVIVFKKKTTQQHGKHTKTARRKRKEIFWVKKVMKQ